MDNRWEIELVLCFTIKSSMDRSGSVELVMEKEEEEEKEEGEKMEEKEEELEEEEEEEDEEDEIPARALALEMDISASPAFQCLDEVGEAITF
jgi:TATA-binding protein-associated factor Taf7